MGHDHRHERRGGQRNQGRPLTITLALVLVYMSLEVVGGLLAGSLALLADAGHMLSDAGALALTLFAMRVARRPATTADMATTAPRFWRHSPTVRHSSRSLFSSSLKRMNV